MQNKAHRPKFHIFNGKKYNIKWKKPEKDTGGTCDDPSTCAKDRNICISPSLNDKYRMEVILHEGIHACLFLLDEDTVTKVASDLSSFLEKCGIGFKD